jgi:hypothetical protein
LVRRPIAFEKTLGHHPQKATRMLAVYAFFIDHDFDIGTTSRLIEPSSAIQSLTQINGTVPFLGFTFRTRSKV